MSCSLYVLAAGLLAVSFPPTAAAGPKAFSEAEAAKPAQNRTWVDGTGKHRTVAKFVELKDGRVRLLRTNGKTISLPLDQLSEADQQYVKQLIAQPAPAATETAGPAKSPEQPADDAGKAAAKDTAQGPPKKGRSWSNVNDVEIDGEKRRPGKRFMIWPVNDEPLAIENGNLALQLRWQLAAEQTPPGDPKQDGIMLNVFVVNKTARLFRGRAAQLEPGGSEGQVERTESLNVDIRSADVYVYFSHEAIDAAKKKLVSTPLSNIIRIKAAGK